MPYHFSDTELEQIRQAVTRAESLTSGEIVPVIVPSSGRYDVAIWKGASIFAVIALAITIILFQLYHGWGFSWLFAGWGVAMVVLLAGIIGALAATFFTPLKRFLIDSQLVDRMVHLNAQEAFLAEEVFNTRERTGILLFISLFEHRVEVIGDTGINQRVTPDDWAEVVARVQEGVREGKITEGIVRALELCGALLQKSGVEIRSNDTNELPNSLRIRGQMPPPGGAK